MEEQLTFTEQEVVDARNFVNFVADKARFDMSIKDSVAFNQLYIKMINHLKKCENHIMELKEVIKASDRKDK